MSKVSIVLPTYNGEKYIHESIESILNQTFTDWELIIVDDCSTDNTLEIAERYAAGDARIKVIHNQQNQRLPKSLNIGFEQSVGEFLTWTSDDNYYLPDALDTMYHYLCVNQGVSLVCTDMNVIDSEGKLKFKLEYCTDASYLFYQDSVGACFMYRREVLEQIGGYDEDMFLVEDYEYWLRILKYGGRIEHIGEVKYAYRAHADSLSATKKEQVKKKLACLRRKYLDWLMDNLKNDRIYIWKMYHEFIDTDEDMGSIQEKMFEYVPELQMDVSKDDKNKKVIIFGAGVYGEKAADYLKDRAAYFADSDAAKVGSYKKGIKVISTKELFQIYYDYNILIAVQSEAKMLEILHFLYVNGIRECCTYQKLIG